MDTDTRTKPGTKRSKKDTSPRKKPLARSANPEQYAKRKARKPGRIAATAR